MVIMFSVALGLRASDFRFLRSDPLTYLAGVAGQLLGLPLLTLVLVNVISPPPSIALGMIVVACCPGGATFVALSHASEEAGVREFAADIATAVRELGLHHPRSTSSKFVTVSFEVAVADAAGETQSAGAFLDGLLERVAE